MTKFPLPANTFPTLLLSASDKRKIEGAAEAVMKKTIALYYEHLTVHNGEVDQRQWKKIKEREDVRVYRERKASVDEGEDRSSSSQPSVESFESVEIRKMASVLTFGSIQGNLDDVMYGSLNPTLESMQLKTAYIEDSMEDSSVLATIINPSKEDPFRELNIKWSVKSHPFLVSMVMRTRDAVFIESSGIALTPSGERIGYHLYHSVDIPEIPELVELQIVRAKFSICELFRQTKDNSVEVYSRCLLNPMGDAPVSLAATTVAEASISVYKYVYCAEMMKLTRLMSSGQHQHQRDNTSETTDSSSGPAASASAVPATVCTLCKQNIGGTLSFARYNREKDCRICSAHLCSRCRVYKTIYLPAEVKKQVTSTKMAFCTRCIQRSLRASSAKFAVLDALAAEGKCVDYSETLR